MTRGLPARRTVERPDVIVLDGALPATPARATGALARLALQLTPAALQAVEHLLARRQQTELAASPRDARVYTDVVRVSEIEYEPRMPFRSKVTVRTATAWSISEPSPAPSPPPLTVGARLWRAGAFGVGGAAAIAALGLLANRRIPETRLRLRRG